MQLREPVAARAVAGAKALDLADDQAGVLQHFQVLRDGRLGERELVDDLAAVAGVVTSSSRRIRTRAGWPSAFASSATPGRMLVWSSNGRVIETRGRVMAGASSDPSGNAAQRLDARDLVRAAEDRPADAVLARLDQVVEAEPDAAVLADANSRQRRRWPLHTRSSSSRTSSG